MVRAVDFYEALVRVRPEDLRVGRSARLDFELAGREFTIQVEVTRNHVWRFGRLMLRCFNCGHRCTRLYLPTEACDLRCRRCWGLTYASRTLRNYKDGLWGRGLLARLGGVTQRDWAYMETDAGRRLSREASRGRSAARRHIRP